MTTKPLRHVLAVAVAMAVMYACGGAVEAPSGSGPCGAYHDVSCINDNVNNCEWLLPWDNEHCDGGAASSAVTPLETAGCYGPCKIDGDCGPSGKCVAIGFVSCSFPCHSNAGGAVCGSTKFCVAR